MDVVYNCTLRTSAPAQLQLAARQRPTLLLPARNGGEPSCPILFTGASTGASQYAASFTMAQGVACGKS